MPCFLIEVCNLVYWCILCRTPLVDIILDELAYSKDNIPHFLKVTPETCLSALSLLLLYAFLLKSFLSVICMAYNVEWFDTFYFVISQCFQYSHVKSYFMEAILLLMISSDFMRTDVGL
jgi:hypothetical protein